jgi:hypothetical protein
MELYLSNSWQSILFRIWRIPFMSKITACRSRGFPGMKCFMPCFFLFCYFISNHFGEFTVFSSISFFYLQEVTRGQLKLVIPSDRSHLIEEPPRWFPLEGPPRITHTGTCSALFCMVHRVIPALLAAEVTSCCSHSQLHPPPTHDNKIANIRDHHAGVFCWTPRSLLNCNY